MNFNKKSITISAIIGIGLFLFSLANPILNPLFASLIIFFIYFFLLYWLLDFDLQPMDFFNILILSSLYVQSYTLFALTIIKEFQVPMFTVIVLVLGLLAITQVVNRIANITNVSTIKKIPLFQVSQSFNYIFAVFSIFISILSLQILDSSIFFIWAYLIVIISTILFSNFSLVERVDRNALISYSLIAIIINYVFALFVFFTKLNIIYRSFLICLITFILLGNFFSFIKSQKLKPLNIIQLGAIFVLIIMFVVFFPLFQ